MTDWRELAACRGLNELFFPEVGGSAQQAREICYDCPVRPECLDYAIRHPSDTKQGVWAGYTEREMRKVRRRWEEAKSFGA